MLKPLILTTLILCSCYVKTVSAMMLQINNLEDIHFGTVIPDGSDLEINDRVFIYRDTEGRRYAITISGLHDNGGQFNLSNGTDTIQYTVRWDGPRGSFVTMTPSSKNRFRRTVRVLSCLGEPNNNLARLRIIIPGNALDPIPIAGTYTDTLTILLEIR